MECAMVLGKRGFDAVHLVEAEAELGGKMRWTRELPTLGDWGRVIDHRVIGLAKLDNVEVITGRRLTTADVLDYGADTVVIATGSSWVRDGSQPGQVESIVGCEHALTPELIMNGERPAPGRVVVYDADGYYVAPGIAELLVNEGFETHLVTTQNRISPVSDETLEGDMLRRHLHGLGVRFHVSTTINAIEPGEVRGASEFGDDWSLSADGVVLVTQQQSENSLYEELMSNSAALEAAGIVAVYLIGDAVAPRLPSEAVFDGHRLAREIEGDDPSVPLPYLRERPNV